jgi:HEAT repeat protein
LKRRLLIASLVLVVVVTGLWLLHVRSERRASYQGKHTRVWAQQLYTTYEPSGTNAAAVAFRAMGSNAVPALRALLHLRDPLYEKALLKYARHLPAKPRLYLFQKIKPGHTIEYRLGAVRALGVLGPTAIEALPDMIEVLSDPDARVRWTAAQTIFHLGPEAIVAVIQLTTNANVNVRHAAVYALGEARTNALPAVPALIRCLLDPNEAVRGSTIYSLSRVGFPAVPKALELAVTDPDPQMQNAAFRSLVVLRPPPGRMLASPMMITTNTPDIRRMALMTLWVSRQTNSHALQIYQRSLTDEDPGVRELAQKMMDRLNSTNRSRLLPL